MSINATSYGPYDAGGGANITENFWRLMTRWFAPAAVTGRYLNELNPFGDSTGLQAKVDTGAAIVRGAYGEWTSGVSILGIPAVGGIPGGQERWDRIVVRNDFVNNAMMLDILQGTAGASPNASRPALTQNSSMYEMLIADVGPLVNTTTTITAAMVIDGRWKISESGILYYEQGPIGSAAATLAFPAAGTIPQSYRSLRYRWALRGTTAAVSTTLQMRLNGDSAAHYDQNSMGVVTTTVTGSETPGASIGPIATIAAATAIAAYCGTGQCDIENYTGTTFMKNLLSSYGYGTNSGTGNRNRSVAITVWEQTAAIINSFLQCSAGNFDVGSWGILECIP